eukprot:22916-Chlamydomonas_euryale.AAC.2
MISPGGMESPGLNLTGACFWESTCHHSPWWRFMHVACADRSGGALLHGSLFCSIQYARVGSNAMSELFYRAGLMQCGRTARWKWGSPDSVRFMSRYRLIIPTAKFPVPLV